MKETITSKELEEAMNAVLKQARARWRIPMICRSISTTSGWKVR